MFHMLFRVLLFNQNVRIHLWIDMNISYCNEYSSTWLVHEDTAAHY